MKIAYPILNIRFYRAYMQESLDFLSHPDCYISADEINQWLFCSLPATVKTELDFHLYLEKVLFTLDRTGFSIIILDFSFDTHQRDTPRLIGLVDQCLVPRAPAYSLKQIILITPEKHLYRFLHDEPYLCLRRRKHLQLVAFCSFAPAVTWLHQQRTLTR